MTKNSSLGLVSVLLLLNSCSTEISSVTIPSARPSSSINLTENDIPASIRSTPEPSTQTANKAKDSHDITEIPKTTLKGRVFGDDHKPISGVKVRVKSLNSSVPYEAEKTTSEDGGYYFDIAPVGVQIEVIVSKPGFAARKIVETLKTNPDANIYDFGQAAPGSGRGLLHQALSDKPEVVMTTPYRNAVNVSPRTSFVFKFSEPMDKQSIISSFAIRKNSETGNVAFKGEDFYQSWNDDSTEITFTFKGNNSLNDFGSNPVYLTFNLNGNGIKDQKGNKRIETPFKLTDKDFESYYSFKIDAPDPPKPTPTPSSSPETVTGCVSGDCRNGIGTFIFEDGRKYVGNWENGNTVGGVITDANGYILSDTRPSPTPTPYSPPTYQPISPTPTPYSPPTYQPISPTPTPYSPPNASLPSNCGPTVSNSIRFVVCGKGLELYYVFDSNGKLLEYDYTGKQTELSAGSYFVSLGSERNQKFPFSLNGNSATFYFQTGTLSVKGKGIELYYVFDSNGKLLEHNYTNKESEVFPGDYFISLGSERNQKYPISAKANNELFFKAGSFTVNGDGTKLYYVFDTSGKLLEYNYTNKEMELFPGDYYASLGSSNNQKHLFSIKSDVKTTLTF